ncbi:MAG: 16S rRNA methyltransferase [Archaeoglobaceae archaeon]|nr:16S rRNA methyltransferase [Archaeoglobaceae archaeon]MDW7989089.1 16S rRNA methyltransferase [Archaeoglobaceae archaeon]
MDTFIFLEASLEIVPEEISNHPAVVADALRRKKKVNEILLEDSKHHFAIRGLKFKEKRGRPEIVHQCLLLLLDSPLRTFEIYVHTIGDLLIKVAREARLPRNYARFIGLIEDLFKKWRIEANGITLLEIVELNLSEILKDKKVILLSESGEKFEKEMLKDEIAICIGAFPHGDFFESTLKKLGNFKAVSIGKRSYTSLYVTSKMLCEYERARIDEFLY